MDVTVQRALVTLNESPPSGASLWHEVLPLNEDTHVEQLDQAVLTAVALRRRCVIQLLDAAEDLRDDPNSPVSNEAPGAAAPKILRTVAQLSIDRAAGLVGCPA